MNNNTSNYNQNKPNENTSPQEKSTEDFIFSELEKSMKDAFIGFVAGSVIGMYSVVKENKSAKNNNGVSSASMLQAGSTTASNPENFSRSELITNFVVLPLVYIFEHFSTYQS